MPRGHRSAGKCDNPTAKLQDYLFPVSFDVAADAYGSFMGRYSEPLAAEFLDLLDLRSGDRVLDVGCGPGALTQQLVDRLGLGAVSAVDPSAPFVAAVQARLPGIDVGRAAAESLPFGDDAFDCAMAQLVVHFMKDPVAGLAEMARVTKPGGLVAANVWDHAGGGGPLSLFWGAVTALDPQARNESALAGARQGHLVELFERAGLRDVTETVLTVRVGYTGFEQWWEPYTLGVGPAGKYVAELTPQQRSDLAAECAKALPGGPFEITASAWTALGRA
jgi:SAM-dependent methyltransferase